MGGSLADGCNGGFIVFLETVPGMIWVTLKPGDLFRVFSHQFSSGCGNVLWVQECLESDSQQIPTDPNISTSKETIDMGDPNKCLGPWSDFWRFFESWKETGVFDKKTTTKTTKTGEAVFLSSENSFIHTMYPDFLEAGKKNSPCCQWWWWSFQVSNCWPLHNLDGPSFRPAIESPVFHGKKTCATKHGPTFNLSSSQ